ncbi:hypothetical protein ACFE04_008693 [Oxalis oulophora]
MGLMLHCVILLLLSLSFVYGDIPTTLGGPYKPVTVSLDNNSLGNAIDLPDTDPRLAGPSNHFEPQQIVVSLSYNYDRVYITWITGDFQIGENIYDTDTDVATFVQFGVYGQEMMLSATNDGVLTYDQDLQIEGLSKYRSGLIHRLRLEGLEPDMLYQYQCGDPLKQMSEIHYFRTMPVSDPGNYPARIALVADMGLTYNTTSTVDHMLANHPDLVLLIGDLSYADLYLMNGTASICFECSFQDAPVHESYPPRWDYWGRYMQILTANVPLMVIAGDHDIEPQPTGGDHRAYDLRFGYPMEEDDSRSMSTMYYSFNAGGIHFVMLGAYDQYDKSSPQYKWLENDLLHVDRRVTPWLVAAWHPPWYSSYMTHYGEAECMRVEMEEILFKFGVDLVFNGHVNAYERSNRVYNYTLNPCGPVHITVGGGGNRQDIAIEHVDDEPGNCPVPSDSYCVYNIVSSTPEGKFCWDSQPDYSAYRDSSFGHGILEAKNETHALWTWHRNQDVYLKGEDVIWIVRQPDLCPVGDIPSPRY